MDELVQRIADLIQQGNKIEAIKLYREATGKNLKQSMEDVERLSAGLLVESASVTVPDIDLPENVRQLALQGDRIGAIKLLRKHQPMGLKEAMEIVDQLAPNTGGQGRPVVAIAVAIVLFITGLVVVLLMR